MFNLPKLTDLDVANKRVLLRLDLDTEPNSNDLRIKASVETLNYLKDNGAEIIIIGHRGRPDGKFDKQSLASQSPGENLSLKPFEKIFDKWGAEVKENLRFNLGEEANDMEYAKKLALLGDVYINEAFASSHRDSASITGLPKLLPHAAGLRFEKEIENLSKVFDEPRRPVVFIVGGSKKDKLDYIEGLKAVADKILVGGRLPEYMGDEALESVRQRSEIEKILIGNLTQDKEDITLNTVERFEIEIEKAGTIILAGPMGKYEDEGHRQGTERVLRKVIENREAYKVAGGGDTIAALNTLSLSQDFSWVSVGGGAMLEFFVNKTLPGIKALESVNVNKEGG